MDVIKLDDFPAAPAQGQIYEIIPDKAKIVASTNRLFNKYPTRYISAVPRFAINAYSNPGDRVLDPFCGSGTTAIEAMLLGRNAASIDIDPFARLLIKVKTTVYSPADIAFLDDVVRRMGQMAPRQTGGYHIPPIPNIDKWFCKHSQTGLGFFKSTIDALAAGNPNVRDYLYVVLAAIIRRVSNAEEVSPKPYVSTRYPKTPADPLELFYKTEALYRDAIIAFSAATRALGCTSVIMGSNDARVIAGNGRMDLAVTSPPYINAYDYVRSLRFEDMWLGLADDAQLRESKKFYIGTENAQSFYEDYVFTRHSPTLAPIADAIRGVDAKRAGIVQTYFEDMAVNMRAVCQSLARGGRYVIVVGNSTIRGQKIPTAKILGEMAEAIGYAFELSFRYIIRDRYLHLPRGGRGGIIKYDEILVLRKQ